MNFPWKIGCIIHIWEKDFSNIWRNCRVSPKSFALRPLLTVSFFVQSFFLIFGSVLMMITRWWLWPRSAVSSAFGERMICGAALPVMSVMIVCFWEWRLSMICEAARSGQNNSHQKKSHQKNNKPILIVDFHHNYSEDHPYLHQCYQHWYYLHRF